MGKIVNTDDLRKHVRISSEMDEAGFIANFRVIDEDALDRVKAADAEPVVYAHWWLEKEPDGTPYCFHCSNCDADGHYIGIETAFDYCPNCGAKMNGVNEDG